MDTLELVRSVGLPVAFIAFERGVVLQLRGDQWIAQSSNVANSPEEAFDRIESIYRPVLARFSTAGTSSTVDLMFHHECGFAPKVSNFVTTPTLMYDSMAVRYMAGTLVHHVAGMVLAYENVCDSFKLVSTIPNSTSEGQAMFGGRPEPYYEFDALLTVIRRSYDSCRYLLWKCFGPAKGSLPRSFERVLPLCERLDPNVKRRLETSWTTWGARITEYRDCVQHYVPIDFGISSIVMQAHLPGIWGAMARIPDNPEVRSKHEFTFARGLDALTFGWMGACEASAVLALVAETVGVGHEKAF